MKRKHGTTLAKSTLTPQGKLPLNPKSGKPKKVREFDSVREWTELILAPQKRGKKTKMQKAADSAVESGAVDSCAVDSDAREGSLGDVTDAME